MIEVIMKMNGWFVLCRSTRLVEEVRTFCIEDEFGPKVLFEDQVSGDPEEIELKDLKTIKMHNIIKRNISMEMANQDKIKSRKKAPIETTRKIDILILLQRMKINYSDNRSKNGSLWVKESFDFKRHLNTFRNRGFHFVFCKNSKALNDRSGWYLKS